MQHYAASHKLLNAYNCNVILIFSAVIVMQNRRSIQLLPKQASVVKPLNACQTQAFSFASAGFAQLLNYLPRQEQLTVLQCQMKGTIKQFSSQKRHSSLAFSSGES